MLPLPTPADELLLGCNIQHVELICHQQRLGLARELPVQDVRQRQLHQLVIGAVDALRPAPMMLRLRHDCGLHQMGLAGPRGRHQQQQQLLLILDGLQLGLPLPNVPRLNDAPLAKERLRPTSGREMHVDELRPAPLGGTRLTGARVEHAGGLLSLALQLKGTGEQFVDAAVSVLNEIPGGVRALKVYEAPRAALCVLAAPLEEQIPNGGQPLDVDVGGELREHVDDLEVVLILRGGAGGIIRPKVHNLEPDAGLPQQAVGATVAEVHPVPHHLPLAELLKLGVPTGATQVLAEQWHRASAGQAVGHDLSSAGVAAIVGHIWGWLGHIPCAEVEEEVLPVPGQRRA
mmetsp:Transcript_139464/g.242562  ORF Transcript_139464/g.242562 Transcript_139464/m.242562 type:complete len:346 (+) Transcript_139464:2839-3876(+)